MITLLLTFATITGFAMTIFYGKQSRSQELEIFNLIDELKYLGYDPHQINKIMKHGNTRN